ncbi:MAG TPA: ATP-binding protein, partial [Candidatus Tectomicrobia bacterium]
KGLARLGYVSLNTGTLRRAMLNLFQRAMDVMPTGGTLTLEGRRAGSQVIVQVSDTSSGIPEEQLAVLFQPFHTTGSEWSTLGLYVVREIVAAHGGVIDVQSAPGQGTTFTITLPVATAEATHQIS